jgi:hypothetical protein
MCSLALQPLRSGRYQSNVEAETLCCELDMITIGMPCSGKMPILLTDEDDVRQTPKVVLRSTRIWPQTATAGVLIAATIR